MNYLFLSDTRLCQSQFSHPDDFSRYWSETDSAWIKQCRIPAERERRLSVRLLLVHCLERLLPGHGYTLCKAASGQPYLIGPNPPSISLSHAGGLVAIAISDEAEVGIDIEENSNLIESVIWPYLTPLEQSRSCLESDPAERLRILSRIWTGKEACSKWLGKGLYQALDTMEVDLDRSMVSVKEPESLPLHCFSRSGLAYSLSLASASPQYSCHYLASDQPQAFFYELNEPELIAHL